MDDQEIFSRVRTCVATALGRDEDEVERRHVLARDLEAESIDYLDITFQLEKSFGITVSKDELFPQKIFQDETMVSNGLVTAKGLDFLGKTLPYADLGSFRDNPELSRVQDLFTVELLVNYVKSKLAAA